MSLFSRLFGGGDAAKPAAKPETYKGFIIHPEPVKEAGGYRIAARIEKEIDGTVQSHHMIRADTYGGLEIAVEATIGKAKQVIDEQGAAIFG